MSNNVLLRDSKDKSETLREEVVDKILNAIQDVHFGSIEIVIHNSQVVQIERREKIRLDLPVRI